MNVGDIDSVIVILEDLEDRLVAAVDHLDEEPRDTFIAYVSGMLTTCKVAVQLALKACHTFHKQHAKEIRTVRRSPDD